MLIEVVEDPINHSFSKLMVIIVYINFIDL